MFFLLLLLSSSFYINLFSCDAITDTKCKTTEDCQKLVGGFNGPWCASTIVCVSGFCNKILRNPCIRGAEYCDERKQQCISYPCKSSDRCNDNIYCNGEEICIDNKCTITDESVIILEDCTKKLGMCDEKSKSCIYPDIVQQWEDYKQNNQMHSSSLSLSEKFQVNNHTNSSNSTHHHHHRSSWRPWVVISVLVVFFFVLVFLMVAVSNRGWRPTPSPGSTWVY